MPSRPLPKSETGQTGAAQITTINIVDINELPEATKNQVNEAIAKRSDADVEKLRTSIDKSPEVSAALKEKGLTSSAVVIASLDSKGLLTLVDQEAELTRIPCLTRFCHLRRDRYLSGRFSSWI